MKLLLIEDEDDLSKLLTESLQKENYLVETASDFDSAIEKTMLYDYDCILLDIGLPGGSGLEVLKNLKNKEKTDNVIIISAKDSLDDKLKGLNLGADDYLTKPFHIAELNARIKAVLRRKNQEGKNTLEIGNLSLNNESREVTVNNIPLILNRKEFDILNYFLVNKERLISRTALAEHVWGDHIDQADNFDFIYYQMKNLRKKLRESQAAIEIEVVYGMGYKLSEK